MPCSARPRPARVLTLRPLCAPPRSAQDKRRGGGGGVISLLTRLHLSPVIWGIILGMLSMLAFSVVQNAAFAPPSGVRESTRSGCGGSRAAGCTVRLPAPPPVLSQAPM